MNEGGELFGLEFGGGGVGGAADEAGEECVPLRGAAGEERGVPYAAKDANSGRARHEEAETVERVADVFGSITERNYGDSGVFDGSERGLK